MQHISSAQVEQPGAQHIDQHVANSKAKEENNIDVWAVRGANDDGHGVNGDPGADCDEGSYREERDAWKTMITRP